MYQLNNLVVVIQISKNGALFKEEKFGRLLLSTINKINIPKVYWTNAWIGGIKNSNKYK